MHKIRDMGETASDSNLPAIRGAPSGREGARCPASPEMRGRG